MALIKTFIDIHGKSIQKLFCPFATLWLASEYSRKTFAVPKTANDLFLGLYAYIINFSQHYYLVIKSKNDTNNATVERKTNLYKPL